MPRLTPLFAATTCISVVVSGYLWQQLRVERESGAQLRERVTQLEVAQQRSRQAGSVQQTAALLQPEKAAPPAAPQPQTPVAAQTLAARPATTAARGPVSLNMRDLLKDPDFRESQRVQLRLSMPQNYPELGKELGLSPAETDALFDLLAKQQIDQMASASFSPDDSEEVRQAARRAAEELSRANQAELEAMLGPTKMQQWKDYQQTLGARQQVAQLRTLLANSGNPLSEDQARPLQAAIAAEQKRRSDEARGRSYPTDPRAQLDFEEENLKAQEQSNNRVIEAAQSYLSSQQVAALKSTLTQQLGMSRAFAKARRAQLDQQGDAGVVGTTNANAGGVIFFSTRPAQAP
jgi:hypothetical protein